MKRYFLLLLLMVVGVAASAQNTVRGVLSEAASGEVVPFANVVLEGTNHGVATDLNGFFLISRIPDGKYVLKVSFVGFKEFRKELDLQGGKLYTINIKLEQTNTVLKEVRVTSKRTEERKVETQVSMEKVSSRQIQQMPSIGGVPDLAQYMQVLPGINSTGDQGGQLYIRGGSMVQNLCLLDGMTVYNPFHSIGLYSVFETDVILNADIHTAAFGAQYGGRISSVMDISTRDGNKRRHGGKVGLNTFGANLILEGPLRKEYANNSTTVTYLLTAKNSYLSRSSKIFYPYMENSLPFDFMDLYGKLTVDAGNGNKVNFFGFNFDDQVKGYQSIADFHWKNRGIGAKFSLIPGTTSLLDGGLSYSDYDVTLDDGINEQQYSSIGNLTMFMNATNFLGNSKLRMGIQLDAMQTDYLYYSGVGHRTSQSENGSQVALYGTINSKLNKLLLDGGARIVYYGAYQVLSPEPRLALKYNYSDNLRFKFAGGIYSQVLLDARSDEDIVNLFSGFLTGSSYLNMPTSFRGKTVENYLQKAQHAVLGVEYDLTNHLNLNLEGYVKNFSQLLDMNRNKLYDNGDPAYHMGGVFEQPYYYLTDFVIQKGVASGLDLSLCYDIDQLYVWATYSLAFVSRTDEIQTFHPHYDRRHTVNLLTTYTFGKKNEWEASGRWSFGSGFPFTQTQGVFENLGFSNINSDYSSDNGNYGVHYAEIYAGRLPSYHRLDLGLKRKFSFGKRGLVELNLSATNVYSRKNIFYFDRLSFTRVNQLPFMASFGVNVSF